MAVTWKMDDLNPYHVKISKFTRMLKWLGYQYSKMCISRDKVHNYLGIDLD